jgi:hypothetical protein
MGRRHAKRKIAMNRIFANIAILASVFIFPPYIAALLMAGLIFFFDNFIESIFWAYCTDAIYGGGLTFGLHFQYLMTLIMLVLYGASFPIKRAVKFY